MMTTKTVTKEEIIKAIETEPLQARAFYHSKRGDFADEASCNVCAVGAVFRQHAGRMDNDKLQWMLDMNGEKWSWDAASKNQLDRLLEQEQWMNALSTYFESAVLHAQEHYSGRGQFMTSVQLADAVRPCLRKFVRENFPATIELHIPGGAP